MENTTTLSVKIMGRNKLEEVTNMGNLMKLHFEILTGVTEEDLTLMAKLKNLTTLTIEHFAFKDLNFLSQNKNLQLLTLKNSFIQNGSDIPKLEKLTHLELIHTTIGKIESIANSKSLTSITGASSQTDKLKKLMGEHINFTNNTLEEKPKDMLAQLLDTKDERQYFVYLTNRNTNFPLFDDDIEKIKDRMYKEVPMGYTNLLLLKRKAIYLEGKWTHLTEVAAENDDKSSNSINPYFYTFLLQRMNSSVPYYMYSRVDGVARHQSFDEARDYIDNLLVRKKEFYPDRIYAVVCGELVDSFIWH